MSTQPFRDDDDDLFNYDPSSDLRPSYDPVVTSNTSGSDNSVLNDLYKGIENIHNDISDKDARFRVGLADALYDAYQHYMVGSLAMSHVTALVETLDQLTDGKFGALQTCRYLEQNIFRRISIHFLIQAIIENNATDSEGYTFKEFLNKMNVTISDDFVPVYFSTLFRISNHTLNIERAQYMDLCSKLGIVPNPLAIDPTVNFRDISNSVHLNVNEFMIPYMSNVLSNTFDEARVSSFNSIFSLDTTPKNKTI